jgi:ArsR family transcriptional regulator
MAELQRAGLVRATRVGKWTHYRRDEQRIAQLIAALGQAL